MNIVTLMDYDWGVDNYSIMCLAWIKQAKQWLSKEDTVIILTTKVLPNFLEEEMKNSKTALFRQQIIQYIDFCIPFVPQKYTEMILNKLNIMTKLNFPYLFVDADAMIVGDLNELNEVFESKMPIAAIDHEKDIPEHTYELPPFINSGVIAINDPKGEFFNWDYLMKFAFDNNFSFRFPQINDIIPGNDQALIQRYCFIRNYDYHHPKMGTEYNTCAFRIIRTFKDSGNRWRAATANGEVKILHYWWDFKPWLNVSCPIFEENKQYYLKNIKNGEIKNA